MNKNTWSIKAQIGFISGTSIIILFVLTYMNITSGNFNKPSNFLSLSLVFILTIFTFYNLYLIDKKNSGMKNAFQKSMILSLDVLHERMEMASALFTALKKIIDIEKDEGISKKFDLLKEKIEKMKSTITEFNNYKNNILIKAGPGKLAIEDRLNELGRDALAMKNETLILTEDFITDLIKNKSMLEYVNLDMSTLFYYLGVSIPILYDFTGIFNEFTKNLILDIINKFSDITNSSHKISNEIETSMNNLMDITKSDGLAFIIKKAQDLVIDFENFVKNMENLKSVSDNFTEKSTEKLQNIQGIANSIEEIAQTIKVLSLNVSIEAANTGNAGKGFQVLARDLREFTTKTMNFAKEVKSRVKDALNTTDELKNQYIQSMNNVYSYIDEIKSSIFSFEKIIQGSFEKIKIIINNMKIFSSYIDNGIKDVVSKLQYYDITSQEVDHLGLFIEKIFVDLFNSKMIDKNVSDFLNNDDKAFIKQDVLRIISEIITTSNERKILTKYENIFGIKLQADIEIDNKASDELKGNEDNIILF